MKRNTQDEGTCTVLFKEVEFLPDNTIRPECLAFFNPGIVLI